jgi:hypothetical protein
MTIRETSTEMTSDITDVRAEFRPNAAADGRGAWIVSDQPHRLYPGEQALEVMEEAEAAVVGPQIDISGPAIEPDFGLGF